LVFEWIHKWVRTPPAFSIDNLESKRLGHTRSCDATFNHNIGIFLREYLISPRAVNDFHHPSKMPRLHQFTSRIYERDEIMRIRVVLVEEKLIPIHAL
jgi:hypothetical protein